MKRLEVWVQPKSRRPGEIKAHGEGLRISVKAAPEKGQANDEVLAILAKLLGLPIARFRITAGAASRHKWVEMPDEAMRVLEILTARKVPKPNTLAQ